MIIYFYSPNPAWRTIFIRSTNVGQHLNTQLAFYGNTQNKVGDATDFGKTLQVQVQVQLQTQISTLADADLTQAILDLTQAQTQQQAALESQARLSRSTLFDYLG